MKIDLHIHSKNGSDGRMTLAEIFAEADRRAIEAISITDHDSLDSQAEALRLARHYGMAYLTGLELNVTFIHPDYTKGKEVTLDFLAYGFELDHAPLVEKLVELRDYRQIRAQKILDNLNAELIKEGKAPLTIADLECIQATVDGAFGRPHIANYLIEKGIVHDRQEAFDRYLVKCNVPKLPLQIGEASSLVRGAGGKILLAHPNDPNGTSLVTLAKSLSEQQRIVGEAMLPLIDGIECWHSRHDQETTVSYLAFARSHGLMVSGGSDCHQQPVLMGNVEVPSFVVQQFGIDRSSISRS